MEGLEQIARQAGQAMEELLKKAALRPGSLVVVGCSSSEVLGRQIGTASSLEAAEAVWEGIWPVLKKGGIQLAVQCCEHLNRALVMQRDAAEQRGCEVVNAVPRPEAGGSFAAVAYGRLPDPVLVEAVSADAGMDIGDTLIGMHLRRVAVPVRLSLNAVGEARIVCARTRPRYSGGPRAVFQEL